MVEEKVTRKKVELPPPHVPQTCTTVPHNHRYPHISSCNCFQFGASSVLCLGMVMWDGGTWLWHMGRWQLYLYNPFLVCLLFSLYHPYILLISLEIFFYFTCNNNNICGSPVQESNVIPFHCLSASLCLYCSFSKHSLRAVFKLAI